MACEGEACCPISFEPFEAEGPHRPLVLPACGHTFSKHTVERLFETTVAQWRWGVRVQMLECPLCNATQPFVASVAQCVPNWALIQQLGGGEGARPRQRCGPAPPPPPGIEWAQGLSTRTVTTERAIRALEPYVPPEVPGLECALPHHHARLACAHA